MPQINIQGTIISFPDSAAAPNWSKGVIDFAKAVEQALAAVVGPFDVAPQVLNIDASNPGINIPIAALNFPTSNVRSVFIQYAVYREAELPTTNASETGTITALYDTASGVWLIQRDYIGDGKIDFAISNTGQVSYTTTQIGTSNHTGRLTFLAKSILQSS